MKWTVTSERLPWPQGAEVSRQELQSCNIIALEAAGHLSMMTQKKPPAVTPEEE